MNRRTVLLLILAVLAGVAWWLSRNRAASTLAAPLTDFAVADTSAVTRFFITDRQGRSVDLARTPQGWMLNRRYKARTDMVANALKTFLRIEVKSPVPKSAEDMTLRQMAANSFKIEIYEGGKAPSKSWIVGHATKDHYGTYMVLEKPGEGRSGVPFVMGLSGFTGILNTRFPVSEDDWRDTRVFDHQDLHDVAAVEVEHTGRPDASYRIENPGNGVPRLYTLSGRPLSMDSVLVQGALLPYRLFDYSHIARQLTAHKRDSLLAATPNFIIRVTPRVGKEERMKLWYMPYTGEESAFDEPRPIHDPTVMYALVQDTLLVVVQRQFTELMTQPASALMP